MCTLQEKTLGYKIKHGSLGEYCEQLSKLRNYKPKDMSWRIKTLGCGFDSIDQFYNIVDRMALTVSLWLVSNFSFPSMKHANVMR